MPLRQAQHYACKIAEWMAPQCLQVEPVGEIRRLCATCEQVELLVIPRRDAGANLLYAWLDDYVQNSDYRARWLHHTGRTDIQGIPPSPQDDSATLLLPRCRLVVHCATPANWFLKLFETTGSPAYVATIMERVRSLPGTWEPGEMIRVRNKRVTVASEGDVFGVLNMSMVVAWKRGS